MLPRFLHLLSYLVFSLLEVCADVIKLRKVTFVWIFASLKVVDLVAGRESPSSLFPLSFHWLLLWVFLPHCPYCPAGLPDALVRWLWLLLYSLCATRKVLWTTLCYRLDLEHEREKERLFFCPWPQSEEQLPPVYAAANIKICRCLICKID